MLYMWLLETWGWMEPLSQIRTKQIMWQWSQNRVALQKGVLSSSNSLWRDSARKSNSHDELKRRNCQDRLIDWPYIIFFAVGLADRLCLDIACSLVFRYMTWLRVMNTNVTRHEAINCIALIYKSCTVSKNLLLHKGIQYPPPPGHVFKCIGITVSGETRHFWWEEESKFSCTQKIMLILFYG